MTQIDPALPLSAKVFRFVLALTGFAMVMIGLNTALGGMATLGWQFPPDFQTVTDAQTFARHDSNARFFAGAYTLFGAIMVAGAVRLHPLKHVIIAYLLAIAAGGLFRLLQPDYSPLSDSTLLPSLLAELIFGPILALWVYRSR